MRGRLIGLFCLLVAIITDGGAQSAEPAHLTPRALLGAIYADASDGEIPPYSFRELLPPQSSEVFFFVVEQRALLESLKPYLTRRDRAITMIGLTGDAEDFVRLHQKFQQEYRTPHRPSRDYASVSYYFRAFGHFRQRQIEGASELASELETEKILDADGIADRQYAAEGPAKRPEGETSSTVVGLPRLRGNEFAGDDLRKVRSDAFAARSVSL